MSKLYRGGSLATSGLSAGHGRSARSPLSGLTNRGGQTGPGRLVRCELLPQVSHQLGDLTAGHAVLEGRHVAEIACGGGPPAAPGYPPPLVRLCPSPVSLPPPPPPPPPQPPPP